jgi:hypothetical protein
LGEGFRIKDSFRLLVFRVVHLYIGILVIGYWGKGEGRRLRD